jgi:Tfp pilus assembly PilM family ATPase
MPSTLFAPPRTLRRDSTAWLGIDIGAAAIKLAQVERRRGQWSLVLSHLIPTGSRPLDRAAIETSRLRELFEERLPRMARLAAGDAACVLSAGLISLNTLELPAGTPEETRSMIAAELAGLNEADSQFGSFETSGAAGATGMVQHTVVSLSTPAASTIAESLWQLGYACQAIDGLPCAHARAACLVDRGAPSETIAVLDWAATTPAITIVSRGRPVFIRTLRDCGIAPAVKLTADRIRFEPDELHELLMAAGQSRDFQPQSLARSAEVLNELTERSVQLLQPELERTMRFVRRQGKDLVPQRLWLVGGGALLPGAIERLSQIAQIPAHLWHLPRARETDAGAMPIEAVFATAIATSTLGAVS